MTLQELGVLVIAAAALVKMEKAVRIKRRLCIQESGILLGGAYMC